MRVLSIRRGNFHGVAYSADGRFLVSLNSRTHVCFWDLATFTQRLVFTLPLVHSRVTNFCLRDALVIWDVE